MLQMIHKYKSPLAVLVAFMALVVFGLWLASKPAPATSMQALGMVLDVTGCVSGRRHLRCTVQTTTHRWQTDLRDWPGDLVRRGDHLALRTDHTSARRDTWLCRNGTCRAQSMCLSWMPCCKD